MVLSGGFHADGGWECSEREHEQGLVYKHYRRVYWGLHVLALRTRFRVWYRLKTHRLVRTQDCRLVLSVDSGIYFNNDWFTGHAIPELDNQRSFS